MRIHYLLAGTLTAATLAVGCGGGGSTTPTDTVATAKTDTALKIDSAAIHKDSIPALPAVPAGAKVFFKNLKNGQTVKSPFTVQFGVEGIKLDTAGPVVAGSGHHHLLIDAEDSLAAGTVVPKDDHHLHFGKAQTQAEVTLPAGKHKLVLQYADGIHRSYGGSLSKAIEVTVK